MPVLRNMKLAVDAAVVYRKLFSVFYDHSHEFILYDHSLTLRFSPSHVNVSFILVGDTAEVIERRLWKNKTCAIWLSPSVDSLLVSAYETFGTVFFDIAAGYIFEPAKLHCDFDVTFKNSHNSKLLYQFRSA